MRGVSRQIAVLFVAAALAAGVSACGGGGSSSTTSSEASATDTWTATKQSSKPAAGSTSKPSSGSATGGGGGGSSGGGGAAPFETKGGDNSIQRFGGEAGSSELEQAASSLHAFLEARAVGDWAKACANMAAGIAKSLQQLAGAQQGKAKHMGCPQLMAAMSAGMPAYLRHELTQAEVGALRIKGTSAFLLYRGAHHTNYFMPMAKEGGRWKVAAIAASALP